MDSARIAELLQPFLLPARPLAPGQLQGISTYTDVLLRWNARINLTAVREPEEIIRRHFGESFFTARSLFPDPAAVSASVIDLGSGAGFPGLPIKIWAPGIHLTLIESNQKKAIFLRELGRALTLTNVDVFADRAEDFPGTAEIVTLRAVERFESTLPIAARLLAPRGRLALLIGEAQLPAARALLPALAWRDPTPVPLSARRILVFADRA